MGKWAEMRKQARKERAFLNAATDHYGGLQQMINAAKRDPVTGAMVIPSSPQLHARFVKNDLALRRADDADLHQTIWVKGLVILAVTIFVALVAIIILTF